MKESMIYQRLRENLQDCHMTRLESRASLGTPDILICWREGIITTLEVKLVRSGLKVNLSPHQISWHARAAEMNCSASIIVASLESAGRPAALSLYRAPQVMDLAAHGLRVEPAGRWPLKHVPWHVLRDALLEGC